MLLNRLLRRAASSVPARCGICARWPAQPLCGPCVSRFARAQARCRRCALAVPSGVAECGACVRETPPLDACFAAVPYAYPWSSVIGRFKFQGHAGGASALAGIMLEVPGVAECVEAADVVLPMPLARERLAGRGFNQAMEIARRLAPRTKVDALLLLRVRETAPQASLGRRERLANLRHALAVDPLRGVQLRGRRVLVVDDVMTSGASLHAAAQALRAAGAAHVSAAVFARTDEDR